MDALILCAGLGTRLRPLTEERPKPLVPIMGRPLASYALGQLAAAGVRRVVANTHHLGEQVLPSLAPFAQKLNLAFETVHEPELLGTGGAIRNVLPRTDGEGALVVFNGDVLAAPDLGAARALHERKGARATLVLREDPRADTLGAIEVDEQGRVRRILDEGPVPEVPVRRCLFTGIYLVANDLGPDLPEQGCVVRHTLRRLLARGDMVAGHVDSGPWHDLGTIESYAAVQFGLLEGSVTFPAIETPFEARWVDPLARVAPSVRLGRRLCAGARAALTGSGTIERAIVWDGAALTAPGADVIVTTAGRTVPLTAELAPQGERA